ncbi:MAG: hypothetical protein JSW54_08600 [Fidelibacterota bacterium]|nr:MAG: hypothetical protein JSW54_08600 [Candidatus Neomarinimicrobiota bacterium]
MKKYKLAVLPLFAALVLVGVVLATKDYTTIEADFFSLGYTVSWSPQSRSFDEAVWQAVTEMAVLEENLPAEVENFRVAVLASDGTYPVVYLDFNRANLELLKAGEITPEIFIRSYVSMN